MDLDHLGSVNIGLDCQYQFGLVNIGLDGLNIKVLVNIGKDQLMQVKMLVEAYQNNTD